MLKSVHRKSRRRSIFLIVATIAFASGIAMLVLQSTRIGSTNINHVENVAPLVKPGAPGEPGKTLTAEESLALGQSHFTEADVSFMQDMIVHHAQAIDMADLIADRTLNSGITSLGQRIALSQIAEIAMMRTWLDRRNQPHEPAQEDEMRHQASASINITNPGNNILSDVPVMAGMLSPAQMTELASNDGLEFETLFLTGMILHHQGALDMVASLLGKSGSGEDPEVSIFLNAIVADQSAEIIRMRSMLSAYHHK